MSGAVADKEHLDLIANHTPRVCFSNFKESSSTLAHLTSPEKLGKKKSELWRDLQSAGFKVSQEMLVFFIKTGIIAVFTTPPPTGKQITTADRYSESITQGIREFFAKELIHDGYGEDRDKLREDFILGQQNARMEHFAKLVALKEQVARHTGTSSEDDYDDADRQKSLIKENIKTCLDNLKSESRQVLRILAAAFGKNDGAIATHLNKNGLSLSYTIVQQMIARDEIFTTRPGGNEIDIKASKTLIKKVINAFIPEHYEGFEENRKKVIKFFEDKLPGIERDLLNARREGSTRRNPLRSGVSARKSFNSSLDDKNPDKAEDPKGKDDGALFEGMDPERARRLKALLGQSDETGKDTVGKGK